MLILHGDWECLAPNFYTLRVPRNLERVMISRKPLPAKPELKPQVRRSDDGFDVELAHEIFFVLEEEPPCLALEDHFAVLDPRQVALDNTQLLHVPYVFRSDNGNSGSGHSLRLTLINL